jgi:APA family basic amino acid/polyamine antiporter
MVPLVPLLGIGFCLLLMFSLPVENWWRLLIWLLVGLGIYFSYGRHHSVLAKHRAAQENGDLSPRLTPAN